MPTRALSRLMVRCRSLVLSTTITGPPARFLSGSWTQVRNPLLLFVEQTRHYCRVELNLGFAPTFTLKCHLVVFLEISASMLFFRFTSKICDERENEHGPTSVRNMCLVECFACKTAKQIVMETTWADEHIPDVLPSHCSSNKRKPRKCCKLDLQGTIYHILEATGHGRC